MAKRITPDHEKLSVADIAKHRQGLEAQRAIVGQQIWELHERGKFSQIGDTQRRDTIRSKVSNLLNGFAAPFEAAAQAQIDVETLETDCAALDDAIKKLRQLEANKRNEEARARLEAHAAEYREAMRSIVLMVLALERSLQARDAIIRKIKPSHPLPGQGHALMGRLSLHAGTAYTFCQTAVTEGWITAEEFQKELKNAHASKN